MTERPGTSIPASQSIFQGVVVLSLKLHDRTGTLFIRACKCEVFYIISNG